MKGGNRRAFAEQEKGVQRVPDARMKCSAPMPLCWTLQ